MRASAPVAVTLFRLLSFAAHKNFFSCLPRLSSLPSTQPILLFSTLSLFFFSFLLSLIHSSTSSFSFLFVWSCCSRFFRTFSSFSVVDIWETLLPFFSWKSYRFCSLLFLFRLQIERRGFLFDIHVLLCPFLAFRLFLAQSEKKVPLFTTAARRL